MRGQSSTVTGHSYCNHINGIPEDVTFSYMGQHPSMYISTPTPDTWRASLSVSLIKIRAMLVQRLISHWSNRRTMQATVNISRSTQSSYFNSGIRPVPAVACGLYNLHCLGKRYANDLAVPLLHFYDIAHPYSTHTQRPAAESKQ